MIVPKGVTVPNDALGRFVAMGFRVARVERLEPATLAVVIEKRGVFGRIESTLYYSWGK